MITILVGAHHEQSNAFAAKALCVGANCERCWEGRGLATNAGPSFTSSFAGAAGIKNCPLERMRSDTPRQPSTAPSQLHRNALVLGPSTQICPEVLPHMPSALIAHDCDCLALLDGMHRGPTAACKSPQSYSRHGQGGESDPSRLSRTRKPSWA